MKDKMKKELNEVSENNYPLIIVFYLDRGLMENSDIVDIYVNEVSESIASRDANMMAFFLPTDGEERIECINPQQVDGEEMGRINGIVSDLVKNFDINPELDDKS